jgi:hypothetical protein
MPVDDPRHLISYVVMAGARATNTCRACLGCAIPAIHQFGR